MPTDRFPPATDLTVVVVAGGEGRRFGGDKLAARLGSATVLDALLSGLPDGAVVVAVGPERPTSRPVRWTRESPAGGGPLAGVAAGVRLVTTPLVAVVAGDMPRAGGAVATLTGVLRSAAPEVAGAVGVDRAGYANPLLSVWRTDVLREGLPEDAHGLRARTLLGLAHVEVPVDDLAARDVDTPDDLAAFGVIGGPGVAGASGRAADAAPDPTVLGEQPSG